MRTICWSELPGNKYLKKLEPAMLTKTGCVTMQDIRLIGIKRTEKREWVRVHYDRHYILARLSVDIIQALNIDCLERLLNLMIDVWKAARCKDEFSLEYAEKIRTRVTGSFDNSRKRSIDLKALKQRKLHGKSVYCVDELVEHLQNQGYTVGYWEEHNEDTTIEI